MQLFTVKDPQQIALDDLQQTRSWRDLERRCLLLCAYLKQHMQPDQHIALLIDNRLEFIELILAAILAGVWITPVNRHLKQAEVEYIIRDSGAIALLCDDRKKYCQFSELCSCIFLADIEEEINTLKATSLDLSQPPGGTMMYTSGTTGLPKGVKRQKANTINEFIEQSCSFGKQVGFDGNGAHLITGPLYHAAPMLLALYDLLNGSPLVIMPEWNEELFIDCVNDKNIQHSHLVPTMFERLLKLPQATKQALHTNQLTVIHHGAAPIAQETKKKIIQWWGPVLYEYWGATEAGITTLCNSEEWLAHPGTVGKALPQFEVFACDDNNQPLPKGEIGSLFARHKNKAQVFVYHNEAQKTAAAHPQPYLFTLGDIGYVDEEGYVYLTDRKQDMIISGGVNIYPAEIEQIFRQHPAVDDVAVIALPNVEWGERVAVVIQLVQSARGEEKNHEQRLREFVAERLANFKCPRQYFFTEQLPRSPAGKLLKRLLQEELVH